MFTLRRSSFRKKTYRSKKNYKSFSRGKVSSVKKIVKREIARNAENKSSQYYNFSAPMASIPTTSFDSENVYPLGPFGSDSNSILQGVSQGQRIGNRIKTKKLMFRGNFVVAPYDAADNTAPQPVNLKMWIFYDKRSPTSVPTPKAAANFFQNGGTSRGFANDLTDMWAPVNTDVYRVLATRQFKLGNSTYEGNPGGSSAQPGQQFYANNDYKYNASFSIDLTKHYPKDVVFNDNTSSPSTRGLFFMVAYVAASGQLLQGSPRFHVDMQYMQDYHYEDS